MSAPVIQRPRVTWRDPTLPHQIVIFKRAGNSKILISCNCLATVNRNGSVTHKPIEGRVLWEPGEAIARWRQHVAEVAA